MNEEKYIHLIYLQWQKALSVVEEQELNAWLAQSVENQKVKEHIHQSLELSGDFEPDFSIDLEADYSKMQAKLNLPEVKETEKAKVVAIPSRRRWWSVAATIALVLTATLLYWNMRSTPLEWLAVETKTGEKQSITLADGSQVWLNENSRLSYPKDFSGKGRPVKLTGEAFFEVAKNPDQVFQITTSESKVHVLGTSFNVRAYAKEPTTTITVKTGKVQFFEKSNGNSVTLTQNQEAVLFQETRQIATNKKADMNALAWQTNQLSFKNRPLTEVFEIMEKHFKIEIDCENPDLKACKFSSIKEFNVETLFSKLKKLYQIEVIEIGDQKYIVKGGIC